MAKRPLPSPEVLRQLLRYEPETGKLFWCARTPDMFEQKKMCRAVVCKRWNTKFAGTEALTADNGMGYRIGQVMGRMVYSHRVIWAMVHNEWPLHEIDHIDHDTSNNRICNLRSVTPGDNGKNRPLPKTNTSGYCGVWWHTIGKKWCAEINVNGRKKYLGLYARKEDAAKAYRAEAERLGCHENHGRV